MPAIDALEKYYERVGVPEGIRERVANLLTLFPRMFGGLPEFVFLEDTITSDRNRQFPNLACFRAQCYFDILIARPNWYASIDNIDDLDDIQYTNVRDFDFQTATETSRLTVVAQEDDRTLFTLSATGQNCLELLELCHKLLLPRL